MSKTNSTVNDAQLKARRTSLEKKTYDELISIILRKDSTERKNNSKIQELNLLLEEADSLNEEKATRILNFDKDMEGMNEIVKTKQEQIDNLISERNAGIREIVRLKNKCNLFRKTIYVCFSMVLILIIIIVLG